MPAQSIFPKNILFSSDISWASSDLLVQQGNNERWTREKYARAKIYKYV